MNAKKIAHSEFKSAAKALDAAPTGLLIVDSFGKIIQFNQQAQLFFGCSQDEAIGKKIEFLLPERSCNVAYGHPAQL